MAARVVFADGSKAMAHNLDDQYERWMLKVSEVEVVETGQISNPLERDVEMFVPELPLLDNHEDIAVIRGTLQEKRAYLQVRLAEVHVAWQAREIDFRDFNRQRAALLLAISRTDLQLLQIKTASRGLSIPVLKELKRKEKAGTISTPEQIELAGHRALGDAHTHAGLQKLVAEATSPDEREERMEVFIKDLRTSLVATQAKLIAAYERIIELQGGTDV